MRFTLTARDFSRILCACLPCIDSESTRYSLGGIRLELENSKLTAVATDGRQMAIVECETMGETTNGAWLVNAQELNRSSFSVKCSLVEITETETAGGLRFSWTNGNRKPRVVDCPPIEGRFPNWRSVVRSGPPAGIAIIEPEKWASAWAAYRDATGIRFSINGSVKTEAPALSLERKSHYGADIETKLDFNLLMPFLAQLPHGLDIAMHYFAPDAPVQLECGSGLRYLLMGMGDR